MKLLSAFLLGFSLSLVVGARGSTDVPQGEGKGDSLAAIERSLLVLEKRSRPRREPSTFVTAKVRADRVQPALWLEFHSQLGKTVRFFEAEVWLMDDVGNLHLVIDVPLAERVLEPEGSVEVSGEELQASAHSRSSEEWFKSNLESSRVEVRGLFVIYTDGTTERFAASGLSE